MTRATQAAALVLADTTGQIRVTQVAVLALARDAHPVYVTQASVLALTTMIPCMTQRCQCWKITRRDGITFAFTTHDKAITFLGVLYKPCASLTASAFESAVIGGSGGAGDSEARGILADDSITEHDLANGLFDGATIEVWQVSWGDITDTPKRLGKGIIGKSTQGGARYTMEMLSTGAKLSQRPLLDTYTPACRWNLGDGRCPVNLPALAVSGTVSALLAKNALQRNRYRQFIDASLTQADGYFNFGHLTWVTGDNAGLASEVKSYSSSNDLITLWGVMPYEIQVGDTYTITPGCDKTQTDHVTKFGLTKATFGGFADIPGTDSMMKTPNAKS